MSSRIHRTEGVAPGAAPSSGTRKSCTKCKEDPSPSGCCCGGGTESSPGCRVIHISCSDLRPCTQDMRRNALHDRVHSRKSDGYRTWSCQCDDHAVSQSRTTREIAQGRPRSIDTQCSPGIGSPCMFAAACHLSVSHSTGAFASVSTDGGPRLPCTSAITVRPVESNSSTAAGADFAETDVAVCVISVDRAIGGFESIALPSARKFNGGDAALVGSTRLAGLCNILTVPQVPANAMAMAAMRISRC